MARKNLNAGTLTAPLPAVLVTVGDAQGEDENVLTVAWTGILSTKPPRTYISVRPTRHSYAALKRLGEFTVNLPCADMVRTVDFAGIYTGAKVDKFTACSLTRLPGQCVRTPTIAQCPLALECRVHRILPMGSHDVFIADIVNISCDESILDGAGKIRLDRAGLLAYAHGEYFALGKKLGTFGFCATRRKRSVANHPPKKPKNDKKE